VTPPPKLWCVEYDAVDFLLLDDDEQAAIEKEIRASSMLAWESTDHSKTAVYGVGPIPPKLQEFGRVVE
jgi:hypothetical protein